MPKTVSQTYIKRTIEAAQACGLEVKSCVITDKGPQFNFGSIDQKEKPEQIGGPKKWPQK